MKRKKDDDHSSQGSHRVPCRTSRRDPVGVPRQTVNNTQLENGRGSPVEIPPVASSTAIQSCGHSIRGDLSNPSSSGPAECQAGKAESPSTLSGQTMVPDEHSRMTSRRYRDPTKIKGVTSEIMTRDSGRQGYKVDPDVWMTWSRSDKRNFRWSNNVKFDLPPGEPRRPANPVNPANPANPSHPDHNPNPRANIVLNSLKAGRGARETLKQKPVQSNTPVFSQANVAGFDLSIASPTEPTVSVLNQASVARTESAACAPTEPVTHPTADEIASGDPAWKLRLFPGWTEHPWFQNHPMEYPCIFRPCPFKSNTQEELIVHVLVSHD